MQRTVTCLWMDDRIDEAVNFYVSLFPNSRVLDISYYPDSMAEMAGKTLVINFELDGTRYMALNGGPIFTFNEAISIYVNCADQAEVDRLWNALTANGGTESQCGWLKDRFGLSWQIVPVEMASYVSGPDKAGANRAMQAMLKMSKIDLATIKAAYANAA
jgi:predicted 3-demethylubiquinone-9 3-methyltransferase (glyoxalase superfamily)